MDHDHAIPALREQVDAAILAKQHAAEKNVVEDSNKDKVEEESLRGARCQKATRPKESFLSLPEWPIVTCNQCNVTKDKWRRMESTGPHPDVTSSTFNDLECSHLSLSPLSPLAFARIVSS
jgi:hypothetical protein